HQIPPGSCIFPNGNVCFSPATPAIDPNRQYVYAYGLDGCVHKYQVGDGTEITSGACTSSGWPELATLKPSTEKGEAMSIATAKNGTSYLYMATASAGDLGDYQGHLTTINLSNGSQHVFNMLCSNQVDVHFVATPGAPDCSQQQAGVWARTAAVYDPDTDKI